MNLPVSRNFMRSNDVSINLITNVNFLKEVYPKSWIILQALPLFDLQSQYKELVYLLEHFFIFFILDLLQQNEAMSALEQLRDTTNKREA